MKSRLYHNSFLRTYIQLLWIKEMQCFSILLSVKVLLWEKNQEQKEKNHKARELERLLPQSILSLAKKKRLLKFLKKKSTQFILGKNSTEYCNMKCSSLPGVSYVSTTIFYKHPSYSPQTLRQALNYPHCIKVRAQSATHSQYLGAFHCPQSSMYPVYLPLIKFKSQFQYLLLNILGIKW